MSCPVSQQSIILFSDKNGNLLTGFHSILFKILLRSAKLTTVCVRVVEPLQLTALEMFGRHRRLRYIFGAILWYHHNQLVQYAFIGHETSSRYFRLVSCSNKWCNRSDVMRPTLGHNPNQIVTTHLFGLVSAPLVPPHRARVDTGF